MTRPPAASLVFVVAALVLGVLVLRAPMPVSVFGLAIFGILHVCLEIRYVIGRFAERLGGTLGWVLVLLLTVMVGTRLVASGIDVALGRRLESLGAFALLGLAAWLGMRGRARLAGLVVLGGLAALCLVWPQWYWHVITHLHNFVPLAFLWDWSRRLERQGRALFMAAQGLWAVVVPALIVSGALDRWVNTDPGPAAGWVGDGAGLLAAAAPPGASPELALRFMVAFAFLQSMHYVVWIGFLPFAAPEISGEFSRAVPSLRGWRLPLLAVGASAMVAVVFWSSYPSGRLLYSLISTYHVYLEFPVLVFMLVGWGRLARQPGAQSRPSPSPRPATAGR